MEKSDEKLDDNIDDLNTNDEDEDSGKKIWHQLQSAENLTVFVKQQSHLLY